MAAMDADDMRSILHEISAIRDDVRDELGKMHVKINESIVSLAVVKTEQKARDKACDDRHKHDGSIGRTAVTKAVEWGVVGALILLSGRLIK